MKKKIIQIVIVIACIIISFVVGKFSSKKDNTQLRNELKNTIEKLEQSEKDKEELIKLTEEQSYLINSLETENQNSKNHINSIREINSSTGIKLNQLESSTDSISNSLNKLKENNKILKEYFNSTTLILEE